MRLLRTTLILALWPLAPAPAQQGSDISSDAASLEAFLGRSPPPPLEERRVRIEQFLDRHRDHPGDPRCLSFRLHLASLHLLSFRGEEALSAFQAVHELAPQREFDLWGSALYGIAQAQELLGNREGSRNALRRLRQELDGSRYAEFAMIALARWKERPAVGGRLPELSPGRDVNGQPLTPDALRGKPAMLVFFSHLHEESVNRLDRLAKVWVSSGLPPETIWAFALESDAERLAALARERRWRFPVIPGSDGFLHPDWIRMRAFGTPANWVVGRDGTLLLHDVSPDRLSEILNRAR
ncbi:MAG: hypothetical protein Fur0037_24290 [Planctomycetota bacterium]